MQDTETDIKPQEEKTPAKRHMIANKWLRRFLKTLMWILIVLLMLPVALYIPPVQTLVKNAACDMIGKSTGMKIEIRRFRLKFPLDVNLDDVVVLDQRKDTMVRARTLVADVKLLPLFALDVKVNRLKLIDGYYRMVSPDSSMIMNLRAALLDVDSKSSANIAKSEILLNEATLRNGNVQLYIDVWKQKKEDKDSTSTPFLIKAKRLKLENFTFGMSMLPTIDTLQLQASDICLDNGIVDLRKNKVSWQRASVTSGSGRYITPTPEWVAAHPVPEQEEQSGSPMQIKGDSISLDGFKFLYAMKGAEPQPGFDASYIEFDNLAIGIKDFYNEAATVRLPLTHLKGRERCGLEIASGKGTVEVDSAGLKLKEIDVNTLYSFVRGNADVPFSLMELKPEAPVNVDISARLGMPDVDSFMPALKEYTSLIPSRTPLDLAIEAEGTLSGVDIKNFEAYLRDIIEIKADGYAYNPLDINKMEAELGFMGKLADPRLIEHFTGKSEIKVPIFKIDGEATAMRNTYGIDFSLTSPAGEVAAKGKVGLDSEKYNLDAEISGLNIAQIMPALEVGKVSGEVKADGAGFNPLSGNAVTSAMLNIRSLEYKKRTFSDVRADLTLHPDKTFELIASSANRGLDFDIEGNGKILPDDYTFDLTAHLRQIDLQDIGMSEDVCNGKGTISVKGTASPEKWLYNADLHLSDFDWNLPNQYIHLPSGLNASINATETGTALRIDSYLTYLDFNSPTQLKKIVDSLTPLSQLASEQIAGRNIEIDTLSSLLPQFTLDMSASGHGILNQFLVPSGMSLDTIYGHLEKDSLFGGEINARSFTSGTLALDTLNLSLKERGKLLDYKVHLGNRPGVLDEFAQVNLNGYVGANRIGAFLTQHNIEGKMGYRFGLTAALQDSVVTVHFTPLNSTIAYIPWKFNADNFVDYNIYNRKVDAKLLASSAESSILLQTQPSELGIDELYLKLDNIHIQDFLSMSLFAPPITGDIDSDLHVLYDGNSLRGKGTLDISSLTYEKYQLGDFNLDMKAALAKDGSTDLNAAMKINGHPAIAAYANLRQDSVGLSPDSIGLRLTQFPLSLANPFLGATATLAGSLNGEMHMDGSFTKPILNGYIAFDKARVHVPMAGCNLTLDSVPISVGQSVINFDKFDIWGANSNPISINGNVDLSSLSNILLNLTADARNCQLVNSNSRSKDDLFGKLFVNLDASVKGALTLMDIKANLNILGTSDFTYRVDMMTDDLGNTADSNVVKFVNFNDTTQTVEADSISQTSSMRIRAGLTISPGTQATVLLSGNGRDRVELQPSGTLNYFQNFMGDMRLNGTLTLGNGFARYNIPVIGEKKFTFVPSSSVIWGGNIMDPTLNITATDNVKANVMQGSSSQLVNFLITLKIGGHLDSPDLKFDTSATDDLSIQNELQSMSADQRQTQAMNLLLYGQYSGQDSKSVSGNMLSTGMLYGYLASTLNKWAAQNIRGVDLSFGVDQYDRMQNGSSSTETSYSYQVSKSLFNNKFKIQVGGNYSTDASADENLSQNLISDVSLEYMIRQTETMNLSARLFRHTGYESILEGEITETGAGIVLKRKIENLLHIFRFRRHRRDRQQTQQKADSATLTTNTKTREK